MTAAQLSLYARVEREFQMEAVRRALWRARLHGVASEPPDGISPSRWRAMLKHAARNATR